MTVNHAAGLSPCQYSKRDFSSRRHCPSKQLAVEFVSTEDQLPLLLRLGWGGSLQTERRPVIGANTIIYVLVNTSSLQKSHYTMPLLVKSSPKLLPR
jgi:hypothetical protein